MYGFHLIPIYNRAQFVDKTDPYCSAHAGRGGVDRCLHGIPSGYNARDPFFGPCWRCTCLSVLTLGMQCLGDTSLTMLLAGIRLGHESAPWFVRSRAGLRAIRHQADEGHCPCLQWCCAAFRWASEGRYRPYPLSDQRVYHRRRWWPSHAMMLCCR